LAEEVVEVNKRRTGGVRRKGGIVDVPKNNADVEDVGPGPGRRDENNEILSYWFGRGSATQRESF
jgi:hypothetical protein